MPPRRFHLSKEVNFERSEKTDRGSIVTFGLLAFSLPYRKALSVLATLGRPQRVRQRRYTRHALTHAHHTVAMTKEKARRCFHAALFCFTLRIRIRLDRIRRYRLSGCRTNPQRDDRTDRCAGFAQTATAEAERLRSAVRRRGSAAEAESSAFAFAVAAVAGQSLPAAVVAARRTGYGSSAVAVASVRRRTVAEAAPSCNAVLFCATLGLPSMSDGLFIVCAGGR